MNVLFAHEGFRPPAPFPPLFFDLRSSFIGFPPPLFILDPPNRRRPEFEITLPAFSLLLLFHCPGPLIVLVRRIPRPREQGLPLFDSLIWSANPIKRAIWILLGSCFNRPVLLHSPHVPLLSPQRRLSWQSVFPCFLRGRDVFFSPWSAVTGTVTPRPKYPAKEFASFPLICFSRFAPLSLLAHILSVGFHF